MRMGSAMKHLSLLSKGKCDTGQPPSRHIEVTLEAQDFQDTPGQFHSTSVRPFVKNSIYMPPPGLYHHSATRRTREAPPLPKTYLTKKGALFLYSEDFARFHREITPQEDGARSKNQQIDISTADLAFAINRYEQSQSKYSRFLRDPGRSGIKPGHSARRHVVAWHLAHPEIGDFGPGLTRLPDRRARKKRAAKPNLTFLPTPYNLPKSLNQIKDGRKSQVSPERGQIERTIHSMWSSSFPPVRSQVQKPSVHSPRKVHPVVKCSPHDKLTRLPSPTLDPDRDDMSSVSSEAKFTRSRLPPMFKNPSSQAQNYKDSVSNRSTADAHGTSGLRKKVRIQLEPVIVPYTDSPEPGRILLSN